MRRSDRLYIGLFAALVALFAWGLYVILHIPLMSGQAYAPYSSYRADPLGLSAFFNALAAQPELEVRRNEYSLMQVPETPDTTLFLVGVVDSPDMRLLIEKLERFVQGGGRLVISYLPNALPEAGMEFAGDEESDAEEAGKEEEAGEGAGEDSAHAKESPLLDEEEEEEKSRPELMVNVTERWEFALEEEELPNETDTSFGSAWVSRVEDAPETLPESLLWRSPVYFSDQADFWRVLYARDTRPVVLERAWGAGSIVIASDSYFMSNEAMARHRYPALLAWLAGGNTTLLFDETHLGISRDPGIVGLMRRYRLTPLLLGFVVLALLFIWQNASSLVPKRPLRTQQAASTESGQSAASGLNNLLRRSTPRSRLLGVCLEAWQQDFSKTRQLPPQILDRVRQHAQQEKQEHPELLYNEIAAQLKERDRK